MRRTALLLLTLASFSVACALTSRPALDEKETPAPTLPPVVIATATARQSIRVTVPAPDEMTPTEQPVRATVLAPDEATPTEQPVQATATAPAPDEATPVEQPTHAVAPVPEEYQELYANLEESLDGFHNYLDERWDGTIGSTIFGAELLPANGNRGQRLLHPATMGAVGLYLDRLAELGARGVTVQISYPLLGPDFPRSVEYLQFYREVAKEVHRRGLKLLVETGPVFPDPQYSNVRVDFANLTVETYFQSRREQLVLIAQEVQPDYLSLGNEPTTEIQLTGLSFSPAEYVAFVQETLDAIDRSTDILVGAGAGTWEDPAYLDGLSRNTSLDFINIHIYAIKGPTTDYLQQAVEAAELARANGKKLVIGESWLYKVLPQEVSKPYQEIYARDVFSFWEPLDVRFIEAIMRLAHYQGFEYASFYWSLYFFSYLDYENTPRNLSQVEVVARVNQPAFENVQAGVFSGTGQVYQQLLRIYSP